MAMYTSDINRVTGLSGIDTETMIEQMMKAESAKYDRLQKQKTTITWQQEAYRQLMKSMKSFQDKWFNISNLSNNIGYNAFWNNYTTSIKDAVTGADSNVITVNSTSNSGKYDINVIQKAENESISGGEVVSNITSSKTTDEIEKSIKKYGDISLSVNLDGKVEEIKVTEQDLDGGKSIEDALNEKLKSKFGMEGSTAKVSVSKNEKGGLTFNTAGSGHSLTVSDGTPRDKETSFTQDGVLAEGVKEFEITVDGYKVRVNFTAEDDTPNKKLEKIQKALKDAENEDGEKKDLSSLVSIEKSGDNDIIVKNKSKDQDLNVSTSFTDSSNTHTETKELFQTGSVGMMGIQNSTTNVSLSSKLSDVFGDNFNNLFDKNKDEIKLNFGGKDVIINKDDTIQSLLNKVNSSESNVKLSFNEVTNRFKIESLESGANGSIDIKNEDTQNFLKNILKIDTVDKDSPLNSQYISGKDAIFEIDGVRTTRPTNDINMNGINFTINSTGKVTLEAKNDVDGTVKKLKDFVEDYNKLIEEFNKAFVTTRPKTGEYGYYEPLTDDEKKAMSEDEIKKYEEKAKEGLLYKDEYLNKFLSGLRQNIYKSVDLGGKTISLYEIGITTTPDYNDGGKLQIDEAKLKKSLEERGDEIRQLFTGDNGFAKSIQKEIDGAIGSSGYLRKRAGIEGTTSAGNNDLTKELEEVTKRLAAERTRLYEKEMYYFDMFAKMEAAMTQQNNQMAVLLGMSGQ